LGDLIQKLLSRSATHLEVFNVECNVEVIGVVDGADGEEGVGGVETWRVLWVKIEGGVSRKLRQILR
jgi:hypothetical protein